MANEAVLIVETEPPVPMDVASGLAIEKGTLGMIDDPGEFSGNATVGAACAGITANEKIASDGRTKQAVYMGGIFRVYGSGNITAGDPCEIDDSYNHVKSSTNTSGANIAGIALETSTTGQTLLFRLNPYKR